MEEQLSSQKVCCEIWWDASLLQSSLDPFSYLFNCRGLTTSYCEKQQNPTKPWETKTLLRLAPKNYFGISVTIGWEYLPEKNQYFWQVWIIYTPKKYRHKVYDYKKSL